MQSKGWAEIREIGWNPRSVQAYAYSQCGVVTQGGKIVAGTVRWVTEFADQVSGEGNIGRGWPRRIYDPINFVVEDLSDGSTLLEGTLLSIVFYNNIDSLYPDTGGIEWSFGQCHIGARAASSSWI